MWHLIFLIDVKAFWKSKHSFHPGFPVKYYPGSQYLPYHLVVLFLIIDSSCLLWSHTYQSVIPKTIHRESAAYYSIVFRNKLDYIFLSLRAIGICNERLYSLCIPDILLIYFLWQFCQDSSPGDILALK